MPWHKLPFLGCLPFTTNSRKFRLGCKWQTIFWFVPLENSRNNCGNSGRFPFSQNFRNFRSSGKRNTFRRFPTGKFPEKVENLKRWARFPGWNFRTEFRVPFTRFSWFVPVSGPRQENLSRPVSKSKWLPSSSCINARFVFLLAPQWRHFCTTSALALY